MSLYAAVARSQGKGVEEENLANSSSKHVRVDALVWSCSKESLEKASKRLQKTAAYQRALNTLLSRTVSNQLLEDIGFAHRLLLSTNDSRADARFAAALVRLTASRDVLPAYLTVAVEESILLLPGFAAEWAKLLRHVSGAPAPPISKTAFMVRESNFNITFMLDFIQAEGRKFLGKVWASLSRKVQRASKEEWESDYKILYGSRRSESGDRAERRQIRADCKQKAAANGALVAQWADKFLNALISGASSFPSSIRDDTAASFPTTRSKKLSNKVLRSFSLPSFSSQLLQAQRYLACWIRQVCPPSLISAALVD